MNHDTPPGGAETERDTMRHHHEVRHRALSLIAGALFLLSALVGAGCAPNWEKVPEADVNAEHKAAAEAIGKKIHEGCRDGKFEALGDEAIQQMRDGLTPEKQKQGCESMKQAIGEYQSMEYAETWKPKDGGTMRIYRFKTKFSKSDAPLETRVVFDGNGKLAGLWTKPWSATPR